MESSKVLFAFDGPIFRDNEGKYYGIHINNKVVERYLNLGKEITFLIRVRHINNEHILRYTPLDHPKLRVVEIPDLKSVKATLLGDARASALVNKYVAESSVVVARIPSRTGNMAIVAAKKANKPVIGEMVACTLDAYWNYGLKGKLVAHYYFWKQNKILRKLGYCIYVTKDYLQNKYFRTTHSVNCSNVEIGLQETELLNSRLEQIDKGVSPVLKIATVGAVNIRYKGHADVIQALQVLKLKHGLILHYHLIGQGDSSRLADLSEKLGVRDQVKILGPMPNKEVLEFLKTMDLYVHPSLTEGLPRAVIEAMSLAVPVIATDAGGTPELLSEENCYKKGDVSGLVNMFLKVDAAFLKKEARRSFTVAQEYEINKLNQRRVNFYQRFLKDHNLMK
jgi:glycosyltransferase involved in cell wall biosynthesis